MIPPAARLPPFQEISFFSMRAVPKYLLLARHWNLPKPQQESGPWPRRRSEPTLFSDDTKLAQAARLSLFWRHLCWDQKVSFQIAREHWLCYGPSEIIISLHSLKRSLNCSGSPSLGAHQKPEVAAKSYFHSPPPSVAWYLLMQQYLCLAVNELGLCFCFQACMQMLSD